MGENIFTFFKRLFADPLYLRVCVACFGTPFLVMGVAFFPLSPATPLEWFGAGLLTLLATYGLFLIGAACLGNEDFFARATNWIHDGGEILAIPIYIAIGLVAIPLTLVVRAMRRLWKKNRLRS